MQAPEQPLPGRRHRLLLILLAAVTLAVAGGLFFAHQPTPKAELLWLSPAEIIQISNPGPWTRLKSRLLKLTGQVLPFLRPSRNQPKTIISVIQWQSRPAEEPQRSPVSTNGEGVVAWEMSPAEANEIVKSMDNLELAANGTVQQRWRLAKGDNIFRVMDGISQKEISTRLALVSLNLVFPSGGKGAMSLPNYMTADAAAKYASGFNRVRFLAIPPKLRSGPWPFPINSAHGFRALLPNGNAVLLRSPASGGLHWWILIWVKAVDNKGNLIRFP